MHVCNTFSCVCSVSCGMFTPSISRTCLPSLGKVALEDIVFPKDQCQEKFQQRAIVVVYDESTADLGSVSPTDVLSVVVESLALQGKTPYMLVGKCMLPGVWLDRLTAAAHSTISCKKITLHC